MDVQAIDSMVFFLMLIIFALSLYRTIKKPSEKRKIKDEMKVENLDVVRKEEDKRFIENMPKVEAAEEKEIQETEGILRLADHLEQTIKNEEQKSIIPAITRLLKNEKKEGVDAGEGIPEAEVIKDVCLRENGTLEKIEAELNNPIGITHKVVKYVKGEEKGLMRITHKLDEAEREAVADKAVGKKEKHRIKAEDVDEKKQKDAEWKVISDEERIIRELRKTKARCRKIKDLNNDILKLVESRSKKEEVQQHMIKKIGSEMHRKRNIVENILVSLRTIIVYEKDALAESKEAVEDAKKLEKAA